MAAITQNSRVTQGSVLRVEDLSVRYEPKVGHAVDAVKRASLQVAPGEFVGLAGESGSGKTTFAQAVLKLLRSPGKITGGRIHWGDVDVTDLDEEAVRPMRWSYVSTVFQSSMNSLNPVVRVRKVFEDVIGQHTGDDAKATRARAEELFDLVSVDARFLDMFPHELSGGMRQRVNLALALALKPQLVLFDEPTTGLDVVVQKSILDKIRELQERERFGAILITHDMGTLLDFSDRVAVMYEGEIVEDIGAQKAISEGPKHPYSIGLHGCRARRPRRGARAGGRRRAEDRAGGEEPRAPVREAPRVPRGARRRRRRRVVHARRRRRDRARRAVGVGQVDDRPHPHPHRHPHVGQRAVPPERRERRAGHHEAPRQGRPRIPPQPAVRVPGSVCRAQSDAHRRLLAGPAPHELSARGTPRGCRARGEPARDRRAHPCRPVHRTTPPRALGRSAPARRDRPRPRRRAAPRDRRRADREPRRVDPRRDPRSAAEPRQRPRRGNALHHPR
ncbi:MAG: ABC transporter ATP-binding protein, partial [Microbacterium sp.]